MTEGHRKVRSFVRRPGRMTDAQRRALDTLLPRWGVPPGDGVLELDALFGRRAPRVLDIGFGDGEALLTAAANHPDIDYLGVEVHEPGVGHLLLLVERAGLTNVRVVVRDVVDVMPRLPAASFDAVNLFFPDPWPKKRHHKRRLLQPPFVRLIEQLLRRGGLLHIATDWPDYVRHTRETLQLFPALIEIPAGDLRGVPLAFRAPTKFERRAHRLGHDVVDLHYRLRE